MNRLTLILVTVILALAVWIIHMHSRTAHLKDQVQSYVSLNQALSQEVETWRDKEGVSHARALTAEAGLEQVRDMIPEVKRLRDQVSGLKSNLKNLEGFIKTEIKANLSQTLLLRDTVITVDSIPHNAKHFSYSDDWNSLTGIISPDPGKVEFDFEIRDSLTFVSYWQGKGLFRPKQLMVHGYNSNPHVSITGLQSVKIKDYKPRKLGVGVLAGYGITNTGLSPIIGVGAYYKFFEF